MLILLDQRHNYKFQQLTESS